MSKWPRLSETLPPPTDRETCQQCGARGEIKLWQEHDDDDQPQPIAVALCGKCSRVVDPHLRLYAEIAAGQPFPGAMPICDDCAHRHGLWCKHPLLKTNGGPGLPMNYPRPTEAICCTRGRGCRSHRIYRGEVKCSGKELRDGQPA